MLGRNVGWGGEYAEKKARLVLVGGRSRPLVLRTWRRRKGACGRCAAGKMEAAFVKWPFEAPGDVCLIFTRVFWRWRPPRCAQAGRCGNALLKGNAGGI